VKSIALDRAFKPSIHRLRELVNILIRSELKRTPDPISRGAFAPVDFPKFLDVITPLGVRVCHIEGVVEIRKNAGLHAAASPLFGCGSQLKRLGEVETDDEVMRARHTVSRHSGGRSLNSPSLLLSTLLSTPVVMLFIVPLRAVRVGRRYNPSGSLELILNFLLWSEWNTRVFEHFSDLVPELVERVLRHKLSMDRRGPKNQNQYQPVKAHFSLQSR
jgi:hypothetical protein